jgi:hypothetical protein
MVKSIALVSFDAIEGPVVHFFVTDGFVGEDLKEEISSMLNYNVSSKYFIFRVGKFTSYNMQFEIRSALARGKREMLMIALVLDKFPLKKDERFFLKHAKDFIMFLKKSPYCEYMFHLDKNLNDEEFEVISDLFNQTSQRLQEILDAFNYTPNRGRKKKL